MIDLFAFLPKRITVLFLFFSYMENFNTRLLVCTKCLWGRKMAGQRKARTKPVTEQNRRVTQNHKAATTAWLVGPAHRRRGRHRRRQDCMGIFGCSISGQFFVSSPSLWLPAVFHDSGSRAVVCGTLFSNTRFVTTELGCWLPFLFTFEKNEEDENAG